MQRTTRILAGLLLTAAFLAALAAPAGAVAPLIVIDPGHGGPYSNANANGLREKNVNLAIALELRRQLLARGYRVAMTRTTDRAVCYTDIPTWNWAETNLRWWLRQDGHRGIYDGIPKDDLQARAQVANRLGADLFISIHNNGSASRSARGTETFASARDPLGVSLSKIVHRRIVYRTGLHDRGAKTKDFYVCRWSNMPSILVEGAFITNPSDAYKLRQWTFRRKIAIGIAEGVKSWFATRPYRTVVAEQSFTNAAEAALASSRSLYPTGAPAAVIVRADRWTDAPTAPALSARLGGPLLWSGPTLASSTATELARLHPAKVVLVGFSGSFDASIQASVASASCLPTSAVEIMEGQGRAEIAVSVAASVCPWYGKQVLVADENDLTSILAVSGVSVRYRLPVLLTRDGAFTPECATFLANNSGHLRHMVLMGPSAKTPSSLVPAGLGWSRIDSSDMAGKACLVNSRYYRSTQRGSISAILADATYGPGYLTAARLADSGRVLAPVTSRVLPTRTRYWQTNLRPAIGSFLIFDAKGTIPPLMGHMLCKADVE